MAFSEYQGKLMEMHDYINVMTPFILQKKLNRASIGLFVEGAIVMTVVHYEEWLKAILTAAVPHRKQAVIEHFKSGANAKEQRLAEGGSRKQLASLIQNRVSFQRSGASIERTFLALFNCSSWPDETTRNQIIEFVVIRNVIVHSLGGGVGEGDDQPHIARLKSLKVVTKRSYGDWDVYTVDPILALEHGLRQVMGAIKSQFEFLEKELEVK